MLGFAVRRRQQQFAFFFGMMCLALCACTDGTSTLLVLVDGGEAGSSGTGASMAGHSGMYAIDANVDDDPDEEEPVQTSECRRIESMWPTSYVAEEKKLLEKLNELRANPTSLCATPFAAPPALEADAALQCASRMRAREEYNPKSGGGGPPSYYATYYPDQRSQEQSGARDREKRAGSTRIDAEIVFYNVSSATEMIAALEAAPEKSGDFCFAATNAFLPFIGIGRSGNVWVMDLSRGLPAPTRPPTSGSGPSGPGNSGTGGR